MLTCDKPHNAQRRFSRNSEANASEYLENLRRHVSWALIVVSMDDTKATNCTLRTKI